MGTHCYIAKQVGPDQYRTIYCQLDGYLEEVGAKLAGYFDTEEQVDRLLDMGDVYSLQQKLTPDPSMPHTPSNTQKDVSVFYGREYGESGMEATIKKMEDFEETMIGANSCIFSNQRKVGSSSNTVNTMD